jgi:NAD-reducing hydrogenase large subunit
MEENKTKLRRIAIDPVSRVEGHGKVTLLVDDDGHIAQARLHIVEFRGFEKFIQGHPYWELPVLVQRLCGICPVSHHLAAAKAIDQIAGVDQLTLPALKLRRLLHFGQVLQSHALHFFHLASPDLLFGYDSDVVKRNIIGVLHEHPDLALQGIKIRKFGQQVIEAISGKRVHGIAAIPGGMNQPLSQEAVKRLQQDIKEILPWTEGALALAKKLCFADADLFNQFASMASRYLSLVDKQGQLELYDGSLRIKNSDGSIHTDNYKDSEYDQLIQEEARDWSYMNFPYLAAEGPATGWYRVGPLARVNNCDGINTPKAEAARTEFRQLVDEGLVHNTLAYHWARMIEVVHCAEAIADLLQDSDLLSKDLVVKGEKRREGIGVIEAPRGTLFHHYRIDEQDQVEMANLIVSTTSNNEAMNESVRLVANHYLDGREITPALLNLIEVAIRAYDPCLSCATHAVGQMPLRVELQDTNNKPLHSLMKNQRGDFIENAQHEA